MLQHPGKKVAPNSLSSLLHFVYFSFLWHLYTILPPLPPLPLLPPSLQPLLHFSHRLLITLPFTFSSPLFYTLLLLLPLYQVHGLREAVNEVKKAGKTVVVATPRIIKVV